MFVPRKSGVYPATIFAKSAQAVYQPEPSLGNPTQPFSV